MNPHVDTEPFFLSFRLAAITTVVLFVFCVPLAWKLSQTRSGYKPLVEAFISMPLVLPPTVLGFYLLIFFHSDLRIFSSNISAFSCIS